LSLPVAVIDLALAQPATPLPTIEVREHKDVAAVDGVNDAMTALSQKVTACVAGGRPAETCRCSYPQELASLRTKYDGLMKQRPEWKDQLLSYRYINKEGRNISGTLVLENLRRQLEMLRCF